MQPQITAFLKQQLSPSTERSYALALRRFSAWAHDTLPTGNAWTKDYVQDLLAAGLSNLSVNYHLTIVGAFYKYATGTPLQYDRLRQKSRQVEFLSPEETSALLSAATPEFEAVLSFMLDTGVRVSELVTISNTIYPTPPTEYVLAGKGGKQRILIISTATRNKLKDGLIFGQSWTVPRIQRTLKKTAQRAGLNKNVHPHMLRHTFATQMLYNGADITDIQKMLGHSYLATTQIYTHVTDDRLRDVWNKYHSKI